MRRVYLVALVREELLDFLEPWELHVTLMLGCHGRIVVVASTFNARLEREKMSVFGD